MTSASHDPDHDRRDTDVLEADLQAYVDGLLEVRRRAAVEAYLAAHPAEAARVAAYRAQNIGLHALFDSRPGPATAGHVAVLPPNIAALAAQLDARLEKTAGPGGPGLSARHYRRLAASVVLLVAAGTAGWLALGQSAWRDDPLVALTRQASETPLQLASTAPATAVAGPAADDGREQVVAWLAAQSGDAPARVPDLGSLGFKLVVERVVTAAVGQPTAQFLYQDDAGERITLYMRSGGKAGQTSFTFKRNGEAAQFVWQDSHMAYSLVGKMAQDKLLHIAEAVSQSLRSAVGEASGTAAPAAGGTPAAQPADAAAGGAGAKSGDATVKPAPEAGQPTLPKAVVESPAIDPGIDKGQPLPAVLPAQGDPAKET